MPTRPRPKESAGLLMYRRRGAAIEVLLVHPGGPFWKDRDAGAWSVPKGGHEPGESPLDAARREFREETGVDPAVAAGAPPDFMELTPLKQKSGKLVRAWAFEGDCDAAVCTSNSVRTEWPRGSGRWHTFPEVDRAEWFPLDEARARILAGQRGFLDELERLLARAAA